MLLRHLPRYQCRGEHQSQLTQSLWKILHSRRINQLHSFSGCSFFICFNLESHGFEEFAGIAQVSPILKAPRIRLSEQRTRTRLCDMLHNLAAWIAVINSIFSPQNIVILGILYSMGRIKSMGLKNNSKLIVFLQTPPFDTLYSFM